MTDGPANQRLQDTVLAVLAVVAAGAAGILSLSHRVLFERHLGGIHPLLAIAILTVLAGVALRFLGSFGFEIYRREKTHRGVGLAAVLATILAAVVIVVDLRAPFPKNLNVPPPQSLLFYPAIAYVVEIAFHVIPLALLLFALGPFLRRLNPDRLIWPCILLTSLPEPILQLRLGSSEQPAWTQGYVGLHVFAFNLLQLYLFRRYDLLSMISMRLTYYLYWHVIWGYLRLRWLF